METKEATQDQSELAPDATEEFEVDGPEATEPAEELAPSPEATESEDLAPQSEKLEKSIANATAKRREAERKAIALEKEAQELKERLAALETKSAKAKPREEDFDYDVEKYTEALADWKAEQRIIERQQKEQEQAAIKAANAKVTAHAQRVAEFQKSAPDFSEVVYETAHTLRPEVADRLMTMKDGPEVLYYLGKNPDKADALANMDRYDSIVMLADISRELAKQPKSKKVTNAPDPVTTLGGGGGVSDPYNGYNVGATFE